MVEPETVVSLSTWESFEGSFGQSPDPCSWTHLMSLSSYPAVGFSVTVCFGLFQVAQDPFCESLLHSTWKVFCSPPLRAKSCCVGWTSGWNVNLSLALPPLLTLTIGTLPYGAWAA